MTRSRAEKSHVDVLAWLIVLLVAATVVPEVALATTTTTTKSLPLAATLSRTESLVSPTEVFALGFFPSSTSAGGYGFGIWYQQLASQLEFPTVVWMPRRDLKLGKDSYLEFGGDGTLALFDPGWSTRQAVWTSGNTPMQATSLQLQDTGNLVLLDSTSTNILWQSFDTPTDTLLPGQTLRASQNRSLVSWRDDGDWSEGYYFLTWLPNISDSQALTLSWNGQSISSWNTSSWSSTLVVISPNTVYYPYLIDYSDSDYILFNGSFYLGNASSQHLVMSSTTSTVGPLRRATLDRDGGLRLYSWTIGTSISWSIESNWATQPCEVFAECGPYAMCSPDPESPAYLGQCSCPEGFEYVDSEDTTKGCKRILELPSCDVNSSKIELLQAGYDFPFANRLYPFINSTEAECVDMCLKDCECEGAVFWRREPRCYLKSGPLFNGGFPQDVGNHSAYLKVLVSPLIPETHRNRVVRLILSIAVSLVLLGIGVILWWCWRRRRRRLHYCEPQFAKFGPRKYSLRELSAATKNFSELIGRGGVGSVYKGVLRPAGEVVAVKRILHESCGGEQGFLAEASSIGQIRHRNLMQLKGWCIENKSFLLVYDYMPNGSLDQWLYNGRRKGRKELAWSLRFSILTGVAAALEYLHEDWQQCVLHRDIKSSNVLLDAEFNAYLGDFGLARLIDHEKMEKTTLMAGTLGYLAPEILFTGKATKETDVYSFGVLMLEVVCGKKPMEPSCNHDSHDVALLHRVWHAHEAGDVLTALDSRLRITTHNNHATIWASGDSSQAQILANEECGTKFVEFAGTLSRRVEAEVAREHDEQTRVLKLGLLCCLPNPSARPSMRLVHQILTGDVTTIPNLPNSNQFLHLDAIAAIQHNFRLDSRDQSDSCGLVIHEDS